MVRQDLPIGEGRAKTHSFRRASRPRVSTSKPVVEPPADIAQRGTIRYCTCFDAPPQEFLDENENPAGSDIDIGIAVADLMGVDVEWWSLGFDGIIGELQAKQCDAINSSLSYTEERDHILDYALYGLFTDVIVVQGVTRKTSNPLKICLGKTLAG